MTLNVHLTFNRQSWLHYAERRKGMAPNHTDRFGFKGRALLNGEMSRADICADIDDVLIQLMGS